MAAALLAASVLLAPSLARAAEPTDAEIAAARQLFQEGKALEAENAWADALARFKKVGGVKMTPQVRFHIALCEENLGRLVAAINGFEQAAEEARRAGSSADEVASHAPARASALRARVPKLRIDVEGTILTSKVLLDGDPVAPALFGTSIPVDPGAHKLQVETDGVIVNTRTIAIDERGSDTVTLKIHDTEKVAEPVVVVPDEPKPEPAKPPRMPVFVAGGVGVLALAGAGVFFGLREGTVADVRATCVDDKRCDPALQDEADKGQQYTTAGNVLLGVGAAGLATAGVLWFVLTPAPTPKSDPKPKVGITPLPGGLRVSGTF